MSVELFLELLLMLLVLDVQNGISYDFDFVRCLSIELWLASYLRSVHCYNCMQTNSSTSGQTKINKCSFLCTVCFEIWSNESRPCLTMHVQPCPACDKMCQILGATVEPLNADPLR